MSIRRAPALRLLFMRQASEDNVPFPKWHFARLLVVFSLLDSFHPLLPSEEGPEEYDLGREPADPPAMGAGEAKWPCAAVQSVSLSQQADKGVANASTSESFIFAEVSCVCVVRMMGLCS